MWPISEILLTSELTNGGMDERGYEDGDESRCYECVALREAKICHRSPDESHQAEDETDLSHLRVLPKHQRRHESREGAVTHHARFQHSDDHFHLHLLFQLHPRRSSEWPPEIM